MNSDLREKLLRDLEKSGFAAEMHAIQAIRHAGWQCSGSGSYFDRDESITRTIDVTAYKVARNSEVGAGEVAFEYHLFVEVKKAERPWVVFRQREDPKKIGDAWDNPYFTHNECTSLGNLTPILRQHSIRARLGWIGYGVHEAFKPPHDAGRWYSAAVTSCKAAYDYVRHDSFKYLKQSGHGMTFLAITHPVVIVDGPLISAELIGDGKPSLEEVSFAPFAFGFSTARYEAATYRVDLVTKDSIAAYLNILQERIDAIFIALYDAKRLAK
ncbi:MAG TPA: hypothetical protein VE031_12225 [Chthoniobacterales bacterium]|nr:hypothetical protein [Chthoniobacterales bacterium]